MSLMGLGGLLKKSSPICYTRVVVLSRKAWSDKVHERFVTSRQCGLHREA